MKMFILVFIIVCVLRIIQLRIEKRKIFSFKQIRSSLFFICLISIPVSFVIYEYGTLFISRSYEEREVMTESTQLYNLSDITALDGDYFLIAGTKDELVAGTMDKRYIYYYMIKTDKGLQFKKLYASDNVYLTIEDCVPHIERYQEIHYYGSTPEKYQGWFRIREAKEEISSSSWDSYYKIYVPEDTITNEFNIDIK